MARGRAGEDALIRGVHHINSDVPTVIVSAQRAHGL